MLPARNANGPQTQNGEIQVDKSQQYYNVKISVKFTCHFCDRSTIESSMFDVYKYTKEKNGENEVVSSLSIFLNN